jgi:hypothetical protein
MYNNLSKTLDKKNTMIIKRIMKIYDELRKKYNESNDNRYDRNYVSEYIYLECKTECNQS